MANRIFITGASGFVGGHLLSGLRDDEQAVCLSRHESATLRELAARGNVRFVQASLLEPARYESDLRTCDTVIHLAAATGKARRQEYFAVNADGTALLTERCKALSVPHFLHVSSIVTRYRDIRYYHYAQSKIRSEEIVRNSGLRYAIVRPTLVLGHDSPVWKPLHKLGRASPMLIPGDGRAVIQPIHVDDLAACIWHIVRERWFEGETFDLGGPEALTVEAFLRRVHRRIRGREPRVVHLPLRAITTCLGVAERIMPFLPVRAGQFAVFGNNGAAAENRVTRRPDLERKNVDQMLDLLLDGRHDG